MGSGKRRRFPFAHDVGVLLGDAFLEVWERARKFLPFV